MLDREFHKFSSLIFYPIGAQAIRSRSAQVTILVPPENPKIVKDGNMSIDEIVATEDRAIELECISSGGKPAAEVSIFLRRFSLSQVCLSVKIQVDVFSGTFQKHTYTHQIPLSLILFPIHLFCEMECYFQFHRLLTPLTPIFFFFFYVYLRFSFQTKTNGIFLQQLFILEK